MHAIEKWLFSHDLRLRIGQTVHRNTILASLEMRNYIKNVLIICFLITGTSGTSLWVKLVHLFQLVGSRLQDLLSNEQTILEACHDAMVPLIVDLYKMLVLYKSHSSNFKFGAYIEIQKKIFSETFLFLLPPFFTIFLTLVFMWDGTLYAIRRRGRSLIS